MCKKCKKAFHPRLCLFMSVNTLNRIKQLSDPKSSHEIGNLLQYNWECKQCKICQKCSGSLDNTQSKNVLCKLCDRGYHESCLDNPPISKDNFFCPSCQSFHSASIQRIRSSNEALMALQPKLPESDSASVLGKDKEHQRSVFATSNIPAKKQKTSSEAEE